jgi:hypothetical protein
VGIIEIGDASKEEALQYLKLRKIDKEQAAQIYELVSGRMIHLKSMAYKIETGGAFEGMCTACYIENRVDFPPPLQICTRRCSPMPKNKLESAEILPKYRYHKDGARVV